MRAFRRTATRLSKKSALKPAQVSFHIEAKNEQVRVGIRGWRGSGYSIKILTQKLNAYVVPNRTSSQGSFPLLKRGKLTEMTRQKAEKKMWEGEEPQIKNRSNGHCPKKGRYRGVVGGSGSRARLVKRKRGGGVGRHGLQSSRGTRSSSRGEVKQGDSDGGHPHSPTRYVRMQTISRS